MKKCPFCAEEIQDAAIKCRYCGEWLRPAQQQANKDEEESPPQIITISKRPWWKSQYLWATLFGISLSFFALVGQIAFMPELFFGYSFNYLGKELFLRFVFYFILFWLLFLIFAWLWSKSKLVFGVIIVAGLFALFYVPPAIKNDVFESQTDLPSSNAVRTPTPTLSEYLYFDYSTIGCALEDQPIFKKPYQDIIGYAQEGDCINLQRRTRNGEWVENKYGWLDRDKVFILTTKQFDATIIANVTATAAAKP